MSIQPKCPKCNSEYTYKDRDLWTCPECSHEWSIGNSQSSAAEQNSEIFQVKDAHGNILQDGDAITIIKDLKVKGASTSVKIGTKVKSIRLIPDENGHNISCKIDGFGAMNLKSEFVKKAN